MKKYFYLFTVISVAIFIYSSIHLFQQFSSNVIPHIGEIKGLEEVNPTDEYNQLVERNRQKIEKYNTEATHDQTWYFWMTFLVTALTAATTLVSSIQAAKKETSDPVRIQKFAILIAILTFCSTLGNFASTHFNELKTDAIKKVTDLTTTRNQFYTDYDKAPADTKASVIKSYAQRLD